VPLQLTAEPPGELIVRGDNPASIYIDRVLVKVNVQNSEIRQLSAGEHQVQVVLVSGDTIDKSITIASGERVTYDYSENHIEREQLSPR
jgi:hypothetical protein